MSDLERDLRHLIAKWDTRAELFDPDDDARAKKAVEMGRRELMYVLETNGVCDYGLSTDDD